MADAAFFGSAPETPDPAAGDNREADIARAAELGRKRAEHEKEIKQKIIANREAEEKKAKASTKASAEKRKEILKEKKQFRGVLKTREQEVIEDKKRRAKQAQLLADEQKVRDAQHKLQQGYMKELHDNSLIKQAMERRLLELKAEKERECTHAEYAHRAKIQAAQHAETARKEALEREMRERKGLIDTDVKTREYQLEGWKRSRIAQVDSESMRQLAFLSSGRTPAQAQQIRSSLEAQFRVKRKKVENEWNERNAAIVQEAIRRKNDIENLFYGKKSQSESELHRMVRLSDNELARNLEDIEVKYKALFIAARS